MLIKRSEMGLNFDFKDVQDKKGLMYVDFECTAAFVQLEETMSVIIFFLIMHLFCDH